MLWICIVGPRTWHTLSASAGFQEAGKEDGASQKNQLIDP